MAKTSTNDLDGVDPYTTYQFWADEANWFWESGWYSEESKQSLRERIGYPAQAEALKKNKPDAIIAKNNY